MNFYTVLSAIFLATLCSAGTSEDIAFLTALVSDYSSNRRQYVDYFMTAQNVPAGLTLLALQVATYTDDSYTTLINNSNLDITSLMSFATGLPWYTRIEANESGGSAMAGGSGTGLGTPRTSSVSGGSGVSLVVPGSALMGAIALFLL